MERCFPTHGIRKNAECAPVWTLTTPDAGGLTQPEKVIVPSVWESHPALRAYRGRGIYEQRIHCGGNVRFWLGGVSFRAKVFLDGVLLAEHYGAYTGFEALAENVTRGEHTLRVEADNRFGEDSALHVPNDYYSYGGINRPVIAEEVGDAYITRCRVRPVRTGTGWQAQITVWVRNLRNHPAETSFSVQIGESRAVRSLTLPARETAEAELVLNCPEVRDWEPEDPVLYSVRAVLYENGFPADDLTDRTGFREIRTEGNQLLLNGRPLRIRGFNRHEEYGSFGVSVPPESMMQDLQMMRDLGANCVRTSHYPNDPRFLDLCDEMGMLVWEESHVRGFQEKQMRHPLFLPQLKQCTKEMVEQHENHPSVILWGSLNECADDTEYGVACYREIMAQLRALDGSRPVTAALLARAGGKAYGTMDVVGLNLYPQWYHDTPVREAIDRKKQEAKANGGKGKPVIISEIGAGAVYGFHDLLGEAKWSEERQCAILRKQIEGVLGDPEITGIFLWQFADVRVSEEWAMSRPKTCNNKGIVDEYRRPKMAYQTVKALFRKEE